MALEAGLSNLASQFALIQQEMSRDTTALFERGFLDLVSEIGQAKVSGTWVKTHFNSFEILGFPHNRLERIHSNILAWLLDPTESHGLGKEFLNRLIGLRFRFVVFGNEQISVSVESQDGSDRPDIIVQGDRWRLIIENKVDAPQGEKQTVRYVNRYGKMRDKTPYFLMVNPTNSSKPEDESFKVVTYTEIAAVLESLNTKAAEAASFFIGDFIEHVRRELA